MCHQTIFKVVRGAVVTGHFNRDNQFVGCRPACLYVRQKGPGDPIFVELIPQKGVPVGVLTLPMKVVEKVPWGHTKAFVVTQVSFELGDEEVKLTAPTGIFV